MVDVSEFVIGADYYEADRPTGNERSLASTVFEIMGSVNDRFPARKYFLFNREVLPPPFSLVPRPVAQTCLLAVNSMGK